MTGMRDIYDKPGHLMRRAQQIAVALFMKECAAFDITPVQYATLVAIRETKDADATRLSELVAYDRSTLGSVLERLEGKGLIGRHSSKDDRRVKILALTQAGRSLLDEVEPAVVRAQEQILAPLNASEQAVFMSLLSRLVELNNEASRVPLRLVASQ
jgi:DNA-binding MarR family transcriptional regulator